MVLSLLISYIQILYCMYKLIPNKSNIVVQINSKQIKYCCTISLNKDIIVGILLITHKYEIAFNQKLH